MLAPFNGPGDHPNFTGSNPIAHQNGVLLKRRQQRHNLFRALSGAGSLTKSGSGTLTMAGANTYGGGSMNSQSAGSEYVGNVGTGSFTQTFGTNSVYSGQTTVSSGACNWASAATRSTVRP